MCSLFRETILENLVVTSLPFWGSDLLNVIVIRRAIRHRSRKIFIVCLIFFFSFRADKLYDMLKEQAELLKELNQLTRVEGVSSRDGKNGEEKNKKSGLFGF